MITTKENKIKCFFCSQPINENEEHVSWHNGSGKECTCVESHTEINLHTSCAVRLGTRLIREGVTKDNKEGAELLTESILLYIKNK